MGNYDLLHYQSLHILITAVSLPEAPTSELRGVTEVVAVHQGETGLGRGKFA